MTTNESPNNAHPQLTSVNRSTEEVQNEIDIKGKLQDGYIDGVVKVLRWY